MDYEHRHSRDRNGSSKRVCDCSELHGIATFLILLGDDDPYKMDF